MVTVAQREDLEQLRKGLLEAFEVAEGSAKALIAGQLRQVVRDLAMLGEGSKEVTPADELAAKRTARRSSTATRATPARRGKPRGGGRSKLSG